jgi:hypothetical protein
MTKLNAARQRTNAKLRYASIHLDELRRRRVIYGSLVGDWERAHQESFLYHLLGVRDAVLQEINLFHGCGLMPEHVRKRELRDSLAKMGIRSTAFRMLARLEGMKSSWICIASRMRNTFTHQKGVPRTILVDGERGDPVLLRDPAIDHLKQELSDVDSARKETLEEVLARPEWRAIRDASETDCHELFAQWHGKASKLVEGVRGKMPGAENG